VIENKELDNCLINNNILLIKTIETLGFSASGFLYLLF